MSLARLFNFSGPPSPHLYQLSNSTSYRENNTSYHPLLLDRWLQSLLHIRVITSGDL